MFGTYSKTLGHLAGAVVLELLDDFVVLAQFHPLFTPAKKHIIDDIAARRHSHSDSTSARQLTGSR